MVGNKGKKKEQAESTIWSFWKAGLDLEHLEALHALPAERMPIPEVIHQQSKGNRFDALMPYDSGSVSAEMPGSSTSVAPLAGDDMWNRLYADDSSDSGSESSAPVTPLHTMEQVRTWIDRPNPRPKVEVNEDVLESSNSVPRPF